MGTVPGLTALRHTQGRWVELGNDLGTWDLQVPSTLVASRGPDSGNVDGVAMLTCTPVRGRPG